MFISDNTKSSRGDSGGPIMWYNSDTNRYSIVGSKLLISDNLNVCQKHMYKFVSKSMSLVDSILS